MEHSIFMDKLKVPTDAELRRVLGDKYKLWMEIRDRVYEKYPEGRGVRIPVLNSSAQEDIFRLIDIKLAF
ncbi:MAG: hypothetical protein DRJ29_11010 [Bacteroidetes bacterium]|nr:MAG: hypothetical protein DRJ29_11010 [Bacteroidota bacterium]